MTSQHNPIFIDKFIKEERVEISIDRQFHFVGLFVRALSFVVDKFVYNFSLPHIARNTHTPEGSSFTFQQCSQFSQCVSSVVCGVLSSLILFFFVIVPRQMGCAQCLERKTNCLVVDRPICIDFHRTRKCA